MSSPSLEQEFAYCADLISWVDVFAVLSRLKNKRSEKMSELTTAIEVLGLSLLAKGELYKFVTAVFGKSSEQIAEIINNEVRCFNSQRTAETFLKACKKCQELGIDPQRVPLKILLPILDGVSIEEDSDLQERWTSLLAAAISGEEVPPSYPQIMSGLGAIDAKILETLNQPDSLPFPEESKLEAGYERRRLSEILGITPQRAEEAIDNLMRLGLIKPTYIPPMTFPSYPIQLFDDRPIILTHLGEHFLKLVEGSF